MAKYIQLLQNMGWRYVWFRLTYEIRRRVGLLKAKFPTNPPIISIIALKKWKGLPIKFFFESRDSLLKEIQGSNNKQISASLKTQIAEYKQGHFLFFGAKYYPVASWLINPVTGYEYDITRHWTEVSDFSAVAGDIKYVWEKSRFAFFYPLIRYDLQSGEDLAETIFGEIDSWIAANPINCGPNWRCSQEISLRVLNWTFALHYYKNSPALTEARFQKITQIVHWQARHIESNIDFSRIAVRNNHAITETLALYLVGLLYPFYPESGRWKSKGKKWFEEEVAYQIYEDGTFLQFSMNYHRVVIQLLTWAVRLSELNNDRFAEIVYDRARRSLDFLQACQDPKTGWLPNYGNNDGALFFPLNDDHFRDYRPQLSALAAVLGEKMEDAEDLFWYGFQLSAVGGRQSAVGNRQSAVGDWQGVVGKGQSADGTPNTELIPHGRPRQDSYRTGGSAKTHDFSKGGYYTLSDADSLTFIRCGAYKDRPFQADNLHLDIWVNGDNILRDAGSYLYNTDEKWVKYFAGTASHNTVMLGEYDQMRRGPRFVWYDWVKEAVGSWQSDVGSGQSVVDNADASVGSKPAVALNLKDEISNVTGQRSKVEIQFEGKIKAFGQVGKNIHHRRKVTKIAGECQWIIEDWLENTPEGLPMHQIWHPSPTFFEIFSISAFNQLGDEMQVTVSEGWYSEMYGIKEPACRLVFSTSERYLRTEIQKTPTSF